MGTKITDISNKTKSITELLKKNKLYLIALVAGIIILLIPWGGSKSSDAVDRDMPVPEFSLEAQEKKLEAALSQIAGAGKVTVILSLKSDVEQEIAWNEEYSYRTDENGMSETDSKNTVVTMQTGSGTQSPVTVKYIYPCYQGALVIAQSDSTEVEYQLIKAVASLTGLTTDKITVVKGK